MKNKILFFCFLLSAGLQAADPPSLLIQPGEAEEIRSRIKQEPFKGWLEQLENKVYGSFDSTDGYFMQGDHLAEHGLLLWIKDDPSLTDKVYDEIMIVGNDSVADSYTSFGLRRGQRLKNIALAYDFVKYTLSEQQIDNIEELLLERLIQSSASFGPSANYSIVSNWMGIRYGAQILAALHLEGDIARSIEWSSKTRLREHLERSFHAGGWNAESLGYFHYGWTVVAPALIAYINRYPVELQEFAPNVEHSMKGLTISSVSLEGTHGIHPDLSDDNIGASPLSLILQGMRLFPDQLPYLNWLFNYMNEADYLERERLGLFYALLYHPGDQPYQKPPEDWLLFSDAAKGITLYRNQFENSNDILFAHNGNTEKARGHAGPDANTLRLIGLEIPWIIGGGRTGWPAGQSGFFPEEIDRHGSSRSELYGMGKVGSWVITEVVGSDLGLTNHYRKSMVSYDPAYGAEAVILVKDSSQNGRRWRINTPEFNTWKEAENGYILSSPEGHTMKVVVLDQVVDKMESGLLRYGYTTGRNNPTIRYKGETYENERWIDLWVDPEVTVAITLQPKGKKHPTIELKKGKVSINDKEVEL